MALVTIQILEGLERGQVLEDLSTPVTIGREDDNDIRLNDERISRFHAKIQEHGERVILTDLDSTNGTRVNGHPVHLRVLRYGDQIVLGRCMLVYGSREQIRRHAEDLAGAAVQDPPGDHSRTVAIPSEELQVDGRISSATDIDERGDLFPDGPPEMPASLSPLQRAQTSDLLTFFHDQIREVLEAAIEQMDAAEEGQMRVDWLSWQKLVHLEQSLATYMRRITEPDE